MRAAFARFMWLLSMHKAFYLCRMNSIVQLSKLQPGVRAVINRHDETDFQLTLMEMGCIPGEPVWVEMLAPMGDPMAISIAGYYLSIRKKDAEKIWVEIVNDKQ